MQQSTNHPHDWRLQNIINKQAAVNHHHHQQFYFVSTKLHAVRNMKAGNHLKYSIIGNIRAAKHAFYCYHIPDTLDFNYRLQLVKLKY